MRDDKDLIKSNTIYADEDAAVTDSFPLMLILVLMGVITVFQLLIFPLAKEFASGFIG